MRKVLLILLSLLAWPAFASPAFEGLTWAVNVGGGVALINLVFGFIVMRVIVQPKDKVLMKSLGFAVVQFILTAFSIPISWIGTAKLVAWINSLEPAGNAIFVLGLFILPAISIAYVVYRNAESE